MSRAFVAFGSNLEAPEAQVKAAISTLAELPGLALVKASSLYRTAPVGYLDQPDFINAVAEFDSALSADELLDTLHATEEKFGRVRTFRNAPRVLDLDLLWFEGVTQDSERLTLPHPRMHERAFVMVPLAQIAPELAIGAHGDAATLAASLAGQGIEKLG
ncbi:2-amino-4-hydroxy-6-hydroxymethyldihydropteridine diphosphokinase [Crenobacter cavernae]|uniref:2-amino-4-hydroxy-6-hydroxymethyldihydropteridine pyrophosphokinase n=1 Tax=Crenobacter cavernae TaxID=2290923 RepID=A0A345Y9A2_9NEIS|nr:2-amino-4-hydroxy-6-hydroxymethyldihydropteridine diphosphokinase [Crenobacter cavernae]AXK40504.1 2-amino-4-hydroxy-6-hydroxymethyldihydropteridine diphosphokinase [Crenobacter cavernae]